MKVKLLKALRPFPLTLIVFPPGCAKLRRTRLAARTHVKCVRERPASPPASAGEGGEPSALMRDLVHLGATA
jgi:hypothetical protein